MNRIKRRLWGWLALLLVFVGLQSFANRGMITGEPPLIEGYTLDGKPFNLRQFQGKPAVVYFWASWCSICQSMRGTIGNIRNEYPLISLAMQSGGRDEVERYLNAWQFAPDTLLDEDGSIANRYGIRGVPALFILGPAGDIRFSTMGYTSELGIRLRLWLAGL